MAPAHPGKKTEYWTVVAAEAPTAPSAPGVHTRTDEAVLSGTC